MSTSQYLETALAAARAAEVVIRRYWEQGVNVTLKADASPVTQADVEAEQAIRKVILGRFPEHGFYGEETGTTRADAEFIWLIDPIDGTKSFIRRTPFFSTQIALLHRGKLIVGVSNAPMYGELAWAERGQGAYVNERRVQVGGIEALADAAISLGNIKTLAGTPGWAALGEIVGSVNRTRGYGDFCHYHMLAAGQLDLVIESDLNILDVAALSVIVEEAGGTFTQLDGAPIDLATTSVLAAGSAVLHAEVLGRLGS
ncbi:inositol monophosphatase family protein [Acidihalobacter ferrooxydans]|uniref:Nus factor SuhB n=1 Tax=Acidihalobacter ferrooxydans TaxID=1765967 RepID=A0A1P8UFT5_9GAMM|nr:inositol monophosphatase family protein [Acidihalobacter ferrooxydans]APZ42713.1 inositol-phosphate phosphatase [Acidihalobacter ferrooxydans]